MTLWPTLMAVLTALALTSCTSRPSLPDAPTNTPAVRGVQQQPTGTASRWVLCADCEAPTPKTMPGAQRVAASSDTRVPPLVAQVLARAASAATPRLPEGTRAAEPRTKRVTVRFPFADATLTPEAKSELNKLAPELKSATKIRITGYTDDQGVQGPNDRLATQRALVVVLHLRDELQIGGAHVTGTGRPLCCYQTHNRSEAGRALNRRAELDIELAPSALLERLPAARVNTPEPRQPKGADVATDIAPS